MQSINRNISAKDIMVKNPVVLRPEMDLFEAISLLLRNKISGAPVVNRSGKYLGVLSEKNCLSILMNTVLEGMPSSSIEDYIDTDALTISGELDLFSITHIFLTEPYRRLPVVNEDGDLLGQVSRRDVLKAAHNLLDQRQVPQQATLYVSSVTESDIYMIG